LELKIEKLVENIVEEVVKELLQKGVQILSSREHKSCSCTCKVEEINPCNCKTSELSKKYLISIKAEVNDFMAL
jgi:hypothetical protein